MSGALPGFLNRLESAKANCMKSGNVDKPDFHDSNNINIIHTCEFNS